MQNPPARGTAIIVAGVISTFCVATTAQTFEFTINPDASGLIANLGFDTQTKGSLVGGWSPDSNPTGTQTTPGLFGGFGSAENTPIPVSLGLSLAGDVESAASGSFRLALDAEGGEVGLERFEADLLAGGTSSLPALLTVQPRSFRTRRPDAAFPGAPVDFAAGEFRLAELSLVQAPGPVQSALTELEPGRFGFTVIAPAVLNAAIDLNGWPVEIAAPTELAIAGEIVVRGGIATITGVHTIDHAELQEPAAELPRLPVELPTSLAEDGAAHLLMDLTIDEVASSLVGRLSLSAEGAVAGCLPDFNGDGAVNTLDFIAFLGAWSWRDGAADTNGDGEVSSLDVVEFLDAWAAGC